MKTNLRAIFFDLDGTLVDTEPLKFIAHRAALESRGGSLDGGAYAKVIGQSHDRVREHFLTLNRIEMTDDEYDRCWENSYVSQVRVSTEAYPDAVEFLNKTKDKGLKCVLVTSSDKVSMQTVLEKTGLQLHFDITICADDVLNCKPSPEPYERALKILGLVPHEAMVIEDSPTGYESAIAAKIPVLIHRHRANKDNVFPLATQEFNNYSEIQHFLP